jgi:hypothetical protein
VSVHSGESPCSIDTLPQSYNLTDGHGFRRWFAAEEASIDRSAQLFKNNNRQRQNKIEREYIRDFSRLASNPGTKTPGDISCASSPPWHSLAKVYNSRND